MRRVAANSRKWKVPSSDRAPSFPTFAWAEEVRDYGSSLVCAVHTAPSGSRSCRCCQWCSRTVLSSIASGVHRARYSQKCSQTRTASRGCDQAGRAEVPLGRLLGRGAEVLVEHHRLVRPEVEQRRAVRLHTRHREGLAPGDVLRGPADTCQIAACTARVGRGRETAPLQNPTQNASFKKRTSLRCKSH